MPGPSVSTIGRALILLGRLALAGIFLYAAYAKLRPPASMPFSLSALKISLSLFSMQVDSYQLLPPWAVSAVAHTLPWIELLLGVLLVTGYQLRYVTAAASVLLLVFFSIMARTYSKGLEINCGCFGPGETLGVKTLVRDGSLLALSLAVTAGAFFAEHKKAGLAAASPEPEKAN